MQNRFPTKARRGERKRKGGREENPLESERKRQPVGITEPERSGKRRWRDKNGGVSQERGEKDSREGNERENRKAYWKEKRGAGERECNRGEALRVQIQSF